MDTVIAYFDSIGLDFWQFLTFSGILLVGTLLVGTLARLIFGKRSTLCHSVSGAVGILFLYAVTIVIQSVGVQFQKFITPLPFVSFAGDQLILFQFAGADYTAVCRELLAMVILSFLINLVGSWIPKGRNVFVWVLLRIVTIAGAMALHLGVHYLLNAVLPEGILTYAPVILLALLVIMLLTGSLRFLVGLLLTSVNPLIAALYTFFFANVVGKQVTRAVLTTALLSGLVYALNALGVISVCIAAGALSAYIPFAVLLVVLWYALDRVF